MATYISLINFREQGIRGIAQTCDRAAAFKAKAKKMGVKVSEIYWTLGAFDGLLIFEAEDEATATAAMLALASGDNVATQTTRAFDAAEMKAILTRLPPV